MSSATERAFIARGDLRVFHEPFVQSYYNTIDRDFPHRDPDADLFERYADARAALLGAADIGPVMAKDMAFYVIDEIRDDPAFRARVNDHHRPFYEQLRARAWVPERETGRG